MPILSTKGGGSASGFGGIGGGAASLPSLYDGPASGAIVFDTAGYSQSQTGAPTTALSNNYTTGVALTAKNGSFLQFPTSGVSTLTIPQDGTYRIQAVGASGGDGCGSGGQGRGFRSDHSLTSGDVLHIVVGSQGLNCNGHTGGGGGGSGPGGGGGAPPPGGGQE